MLADLLGDFRLASLADRGRRYVGGVRLVIADNDATALELAVLDLGLEGHEIVATAVDGAAAVVACEQHHPDVLVVDYRMPPGINGLDVALRVLADGLAGSVVLHTNYGDAEVRRVAAQVGAGFVRKGDLDALRAAVARRVR